MARIRSKESTLQEDALTSITVTLPTHVANDLLVVCITRDNNREDFSTPSGWTQAASVGVGSSGVTSNAARSAIYWKVAASGAETNPTFTIVNADEMMAVALAIEGADLVTPMDITPITGTDIVTPAVALPAVTTATDNALVFHYVGNDCTSGNATSTPPADWVTVELSTVNTIISQALAMTVQQTAGTVPANTAVNLVSASDETTIISFAIRDGSSGGIMQGYPLLGSIATVDLLRYSNNTTPGNYFSSKIVDYTKLWNFGVPVTTYDPTSCWQVTAVGPVFVNMLTQATNDTQGDVIPFPASEAVGDYFAVGYSEPFTAILFDRTGSIAQGGGTHLFDYWNGSAWVQLLVNQFFDGTSSTNNSFFNQTLANVTGQTVFKIKPPSNWATLSLNGETADYKIRIRVNTVMTTNPTITRIKIVTDASAILAVPSGVLGTTTVNGGLNFYENGIPNGPGQANCTYSRTIAIAAHIPATSWNLSTGFLVFGLTVNSSLNFYAMGKKSQGGAQFGFADANGNIKSWCVAAYDTKDSVGSGWMVPVIQLNQSTDTTWRTSSSPPAQNPIYSFFTGITNWGSVTSRVSSFSRLVHIPSTYHICGGGTSAPLSWSDVLDVANAFEIPLIDKASGNCVVALQFGGTKKVCVDASVFTLSYLPHATTSSLYSKNHVDDGVLGVVIDARAGDVVKLTSGSIVGGSKIRFEMLATCSASATYSFNGLTVVNANVTMRPVKTFSAMQFINCTTFAQNETVFDGCSFNGSTITCDKVEGFSNCTFTCSAEHALVLGASEIGTHNFFGNTFSGYGADGSSTAAIYNNSGGLVTLQLSVGDPTPTVKNGAGASTVILAPQATASVTNITAGSRIQVYNTTTATEIANEVVPGTSWSLSYNNGSEFTAGDEVRLRLVYVNGVTAKRAWSGIAVATSTGFTVIAMQVDDAIYEQFGIDGSTVTEFTFDTPNLQIDINDPDNLWYASRLYAYMMHYQMSSSGIANAFDTVYGTDNGNIRLNGAYLDNLSANTAKQGDAIRIYREDDQLPVVNPTTGGGGLTFFATGTIYIAETGVSGLTPDESATLAKLDTIEPLCKLIPATV